MANASYANLGMSQIFYLIYAFLVSRITFTIVQPNYVKSVKRIQQMQHLNNFNAPSATMNVGKTIKSLTKIIFANTAMSDINCLQPSTSAKNAKKMNFPMHPQNSSAIKLLVSKTILEKTKTMLKQLIP